MTQRTNERLIVIEFSCLYNDRLCVKRMEILFTIVGRGRWVMYDGMQYDLIQGQGHEPFKVENEDIFKRYLLRHLQWELATDHGFLN